MSEILQWTAVETVTRLKARDVSASEVTEAHLDRLEDVRDLNAVVEDVPEAMDWARAIDDGRRAPGLLHGAPLTVKINADMAGYANSNGLKGLANNIGAEDSAVIGNLRAAGGTIIGRTNTPEMSLRWCTSNPLHGVTLNPWDKTVTPGGSSGGAAAAVSTGVGVLAHGNDLGGSVRYPAHACGIVGHKPSRGQVPAFNPSAATDRPEMTMAFSVQGVLARSVADLQLGLDAMRAFHPGDANWTGARGTGPIGEDRGIRIGIARGCFPSAEADEVAKAIDKAEAASREAGFSAREIALPETQACVDVWGRLLFTETQAMYESLIRNEGSDAMQVWIDTFTHVFEPLDLNGYIHAMTERQRLQRAWSALWKEVDALILPVSLIPPFENDLDLKEPARGPELIAAQAPLYVVNLLGLPGTALPTHVAQGIPQGVQIVGPMHEDDRVIDIAKRLETHLGTILHEMPAPYRVL